MSAPPYSSHLAPLDTREKLESLVLKEKKGDYSILTLNRPKANVLNYSMFQALRFRFHEAEFIDKVRGVIITGKPGLFSAGLDSAELATPDVRAFTEWFSFVNEAYKEMFNTSLLTIAAVSGHSPAGGCLIALCCDYRIMSRGSFGIGLNEVAIGLKMPPHLAALAQYAVGNQVAEKMLLTGKLWTPDEAKALGIIDDVVDPKDLISHAEKIMRERLNSTFSRAYGATKKVLRAELVAKFDEAKRNQWSATLTGVYERENLGFAEDIAIGFSRGMKPKL
jgi:3,2-trans-enoyl-CoA isomerase